MRLAPPCVFEDSKRVNATDRGKEAAGFEGGGGRKTATSTPKADDNGGKRRRRPRWMIRRQVARTVYDND